LRYYDPDGNRAEQIADQALELWLVMPSFGQVQDVEHAGGPTEQSDPDYPDLERYVITCLGHRHQHAIRITTSAAFIRRHV
jgi:hypothetical protein